MDNIAHPGDEPAHFIGESMDRFELITNPTAPRRRRHPPLAAGLPLAHQDLFAGIHKDSGGNVQGPRVESDSCSGTPPTTTRSPTQAMPEMKSANKQGSKDNPKYFRGDEQPVPTVQAALQPMK